MVFHDGSLRVGFPLVLWLLVGSSPGTDQWADRQPQDVGTTPAKWRSRTGLITLRCDTLAVETIGPSSEEEMVAAFLQAEIAGARYESQVRFHMSLLGVTQTLVEEPDLASGAENELRSRLLTAYRGWRIDQALFRGWPDGLVWTRVALRPTDGQHIWYANAPEWTQLSRGTRKEADGAKRIAERDPSLRSWSPGTLEAINGVCAAIETGQPLPPIIAIGVPSGAIIMLVEGHARMTAYLSADLLDGLEIIYGAAPLVRLQSWGWCPPSLQSLGIIGADRTQTSSPSAK